MIREPQSQDIVGQWHQKDEYRATVTGHSRPMATKDEWRATITGHCRQMAQKDELRATITRHSRQMTQTGCVESQTSQDICSQKHQEEVW